ncbi:Peptidase S1 and S6 chymotrypsin/Hap [Chlamydiales bacterium STE3]|nr:Peptidase S1 and S6 chymotrypsin/Hap [Chlamydiales bacterium STE3]
MIFDLNVRNGDYERSDSYESVEKTLYRKDSRFNLYELESQTMDRNFIQKVRKNARSVAALVDLERLQENNDGNFEIRKDKVRSLKQNVPWYEDPAAPKQVFGVPLASDVKFQDEPCLAFGTAFLVGKKTALTNAHCVCVHGTNTLVNLKERWVVFNFQMTGKDEAPQGFPKNSVYKIERVKAHRYNEYSEITQEGESYKDWAILKLDRNVEGIEPLPISFADVEYDPEKKREVYMLGHPNGLPLKLATDGEIQPNTYQGQDKNERVTLYQEKYHPDIFSHNLPAYSGNSGSPVFCAKTHEVIGITFRGPKDFEKCKDKQVVKNRFISEDYA